VGRCPFTKEVPAADKETGGFVVILNILRSVPNDAARVETVVRADGRMTGKIDVRAKATARADGDIGVNDRVGADLDCGINLGFGANDGCGMDHGKDCETFNSCSANIAGKMSP
jgi:hypothetical protein